MKINAFCLFKILSAPIGIFYKNYLVINLGRIGDSPIMLAKPQTFMNASGESVSILIPSHCGY
jgi:peptidyl-tRNA hydrolase